MISYLQTPARVSAEVAALCELVSPGAIPVFIDVEPDNSFQPDSCYPNVEALVATDGGESVFGWAVYEWPRVWFEFQHHAVWRDPDGVLRDKTPRADNEKVALFLPDGPRYEGMHIPTRWFPASDRPEIKRMTEIQEKINNLKAAHFNKVGEYTELDERSAQPVIRLETEKALIVDQMNYMPSRNDLCPCFSRKKFKRCHGR